MILEQYVNKVLAVKIRDNQVGKVAGIVRPVTLNIGGVIKTVPAWKKWLKDAECKPDELGIMTPDSKDGGVLYFEYISDEYGPKLSAAQIITTSLRLVYWYDSRRWDVDRHKVSRVLMNMCEIGQTLIFEEQFKVLKVSAGNLLPSGAYLFSKYTYDEAEAQYLMPPYDVIAFEVKIKWILLKLPCGLKGAFSKEPVC